MREVVIPILRVEDADRSVAWYERLGFSKEWEHRFKPGLPAFVSVARGEIRLFLSEHRGAAAPDTLVYLRVEDVEIVAREFETNIEKPPWAQGEVHIKDPDGNRLRIAKPN